MKTVSIALTALAVGVTVGAGAAAVTTTTTVIATTTVGGIAATAIGSAIGLVFGVLLGGSRWFDRLVGPSFHTLKQISLFAWIPMLSMWFGLGDGAKIAFVAMAAFFPVVLNTFEGIRSVPRESIEVARVFDFSPWQLLTRVIAPSAAPARSARGRWAIAGRSGSMPTAQWPQRSRHLTLQNPTARIASPC